MATGPRVPGDALGVRSNVLWGVRVSPLEVSGSGSADSRLKNKNEELMPGRMKSEKHILRGA